MPTNLETLKSRLSELNAIGAAAGMMGWDQQTFMPPGGAGARAQHMGILSRMYHEMSISDEMRRLIGGSLDEVEPDSDDAALLRVVKRSFDIATKIPTALVEEQTTLGVQGHEIWVAARKENEFAKFRPCLERMVEICREIAGYLGYKEHIYDAMCDLFEEGATTADCRNMYEAIKKGTVPLVKAIQDSGKQPDDGILHGKWPVEKQKALTEKLVKAIGFDFNRGRQDTAAHPFCGGWSRNDVRLTTRFLDYLPSAVFSSLHEAGHGMYEQNQRPEWDLTPLGGGCSCAWHESQSRTWENIVGRSKAFWTKFLPDLHEAFPELKSVDVSAFYRMINKVQSSLVRVEADEVTYNLHTLVRFEIECDLMTGALAVKDIPEVWNAKYEEYLGIRPPTDSDGCLQDVHWSGGMIGYFPSYSMGNMLSFQVWSCLQKDLGDTDAMIAKGDFEPILGWLTEKVYRQGQRYTPKELALRVTGKPMGADDYVAALNKKYREVYGV